MKRVSAVAFPIGFKAHAVAAGLKRSGALDLALFYSAFPARCANLFTVNKVQAAPLKVSHAHLKRGKGIHAIIANSGNANCFTGAAGIKDAQDTSHALSLRLGVPVESILVSSTGIIGKPLPLKKIKDAIPSLVKGLSDSGMQKAAKAIMTTDTFPKMACARAEIGGKRVTICGVAKGSGMIAPHMATMLCFLFTDANITRGALKKALRLCADHSFNCITVDGCMSTNDTVTILANGAAGNPLISTHAHFSEFVRALQEVCSGLAKMIVRDGEGATKFIQITVKNAATAHEARRAALAIANSNLFKCAMYGSSANIFGRMVAAMGGAGIEVKEKGLKINYTPLKKKDVSIEVSLNRGKARAVVYTSDLTPLYVKINAQYN